MDGAKPMTKIITLITSLFLVTGCSQMVSKNDLYGEYEAKFSYGVEKIVLKDTGNYEQEFRFSDSDKVLKNAGKWEYNPKGAFGPTVIIKKSMIIDDYNKPDPKIGQIGNDWALPITKFLGKIEFSMYPDLDINLKKKS
jgi:hypothetical protein